MNRELALYFGHDFVMGAVQPYEDHFKVLTKRDEQIFPLYFYIDPTSNSWDYGDRYRVDYERNDPNAIGNFYQLIQENRSTFTVRGGYEKDYIDLLDKILNDLKDSYVEFYSGLQDSEVDLRSISPVPVRIGWSDNVPEGARPLLEEYLNNRGFKTGETMPVFGELLVRRLLLERKVNPDVRKVLVLDAFSSDLNASLVKIQGSGKVHRESLGIYRGYGADPRVRVIAKFVVNEVNSGLHVLHTDELKEAEYARHLEPARKWRDQLDATRRPFISVKTTIRQAPNSSFRVNIEKKEVKELSRLHLLQLIRYLEGQIRDSGMDTQDLDAVVVIGDMLNHAGVQQELRQSFGEDKIIRKSEKQLSELLKTMLSDSPVAPGSEAAQSPTGPPQPPAGENQTLLLSSQLQRGEKIEFSWAPAGKAVRRVQAMYQGNLTFQIVKAENSSVIDGDTFRCEGFFLGRPAVLRSVFRTLKDQALGDYSTRNPLIGLRKV